MSDKNTSETEYEKFISDRQIQRIVDMNANKIVKFLNSKPCENFILEELQNNLKTVFSLLEKNMGAYALVGFFLNKARSNRENPPEFIFF